MRVSSSAASRCLTVAAILIAFSCGPVAVAGPFIVVENDSRMPAVLSDLVVLNDSGNKKVILKPSDPSDDITLPSGDSRIFDAGFEITRYTISRTNGADEFKTAIFDVRQLRPKKVAFIDNPDPSGPDVYLAINYLLYNFEPPAEGDIIRFEDGLNSSLPGWFVGTSIDFEEGIVSNPYTGEVEINFTGFVVSTVVPEPCTLVLAGIGAVVLCGYSRWHRKFPASPPRCRSCAN